MTDAGTENTPQFCVPASFAQFILLKSHFTHKDQIKMWRWRLTADNLDTRMDGDPLMLALIQPLSAESKMLLDRRWRQRELLIINISNLSYAWVKKK